MSYHLVLFYKFMWHIYIYHSISVSYICVFYVLFKALNLIEKDTLLVSELGTKN